MLGLYDLRRALERADELLAEAVRERLARLAHPRPGGVRRLVARALFAVARAAADVGRSVDVAEAA